MQIPTHRFRLTLSALLAACSALLVACGGDDEPIDAPTTPVAAARPLPGPFEVGCSNVAQDFARLAPGDAAEDYWEGRPAADGRPRYASDLLSAPLQTLTASVTAPSDPTLYGSFAGRRIDYTVLVCYPTRADNPRPAFVLPDGRVVPHMQAGAEAPLWADDAARHPLLLFSHGLAGSPLSDDGHLKVLLWLASHGYVVAAPFHGDPRIADLQIDDLGDAVAFVRKLDDAVAMQALRPLALAATLDMLLAHPQWRDGLDATQVGGFGASLGGEAMLLLAGASLTTSPTLSSAPVGVDARLKAAVGYVPYFGQPLLPVFGRDQSGLDRVTMPYLAIGGTADTTAPLALTQEGMQRLGGPRMLVSIAGQEHRFDEASAPDILTWSLVFLDAYVRGDRSARAQLGAMSSVDGGADDRLLLPLQAP